jgi:hypothetical protein
MTMEMREQGGCVRKVQVEDTNSAVGTNCVS